MDKLMAVVLAGLVYCVIMLPLTGNLGRKLKLRTRLNNLKTVTSKQTGRPSPPKNGSRPVLSFLHVPQKIRGKLIAAGIRLRPEEFVMIWICTTLIPALLAYLVGGGLLFCLILVAVGVVVPPAAVSLARKKRIERFNTQLGDALMIISNSLRAGFSFEQSLGNISKELPDPLGPEFVQAVRELELGASLETVLTSIAERMQSKDMELLNAAVVIQRQVGGNLSEIIDNISETIRDRIAIKRNIKTLTAQGRISGKIIGALPLFLLGLISMVNPDYMRPLFTTPYGYMMLTISAILEGIGFLVIQKLVDIKY
jgi:Flp pilus assembly protein TadB